MKFEWFLARRYFKGNRKGSRFLSFIKVMAIGGVAIGSAGLLIALSIVHGFKSEINNKILGFAPHIEISSFTQDPLYQADTLVSYLSGFPEIEESQMVVQGQVMIQTYNQVDGTILKGVDTGGDVSGLRSYVSQGDYNLRVVPETGLPGIVIGKKLADRIEADIGSTITIYTIDEIPSLLNSPELQQFTLTGIYETGIDRFDDIYALADRSYGYKLFGLPEGQANRVEVRLKNTSQINSFTQKIKQKLDFPYYVENIFIIYANIFAWVNLQEETIPFVISVMVIIAAFNLIGTVLMMILERTRDIGILKAMGAKGKEIRTVFLLEGVFVAVAGLLIGILISVGFYLLQSNFGIIPLSEENYYMSTAPVQPHMLDFVIVSIVTLILCALASWIPARVAANTDPLKIISYGR